MPDRGDILRLHRRLGFLPRGHAESVVLVQADPLNAVLSTVLVVPLDPAIGAYQTLPTVRVSREEAGAAVDHVAVPWQLYAVPADWLAPGAVGRLRSGTLQALDDLIKLVLDLT